MDTTEDYDMERYVKALLFDYLREKRSSMIADFFWEEMEATESLSRGSPSLVEVIEYYQRMSKRKIGLIPREESSSFDDWSSDDMGYVSTKKKPSRSVKGKAKANQTNDASSGSEESSSDDEPAFKKRYLTRAQRKSFIESSSKEVKKPSKKKRHVTTPAVKTFLKVQLLEESSSEDEPPPKRAVRVATLRNIHPIELPPPPERAARIATLRNKHPIKLSPMREESSKDSGKVLNSNSEENEKPIAKLCQLKQPKVVKKENSNENKPPKETNLNVAAMREQPVSVRKEQSSEDDSNRLKRCR